MVAMETTKMVSMVTGQILENAQFKTYIMIIRTICENLIKRYGTVFKIIIRHCKNPDFEKNPHSQHI